MARRPSVLRREPPEATPAEVETPRLSGDSRHFFIWLLSISPDGGCAAFIYEIVWFQLLQLVIGSSTPYRWALLLAAYMGGLCLGSAALPRLVSSQIHPMRVYAYLELGIGAFGIVALFGVPLVGRIYVAGATEGTFGLVLRGLVAAACLLPPTVLMGASLPAISRWVETTPKGISRLGLLYSSNVAGAIVGCVLAGFYLLRVYDMGVATYAACAINVTVALAALAMARGGAYIKEQARSVVDRAPGVPLVYVAIALSGLTALGAEVVWTRLLSLLLGATVYTFSIILAVFLFGLWAGSSCWLGPCPASCVRAPPSSGRVPAFCSHWPSRGLRTFTIAARAVLIGPSTHGSPPVPGLISIST